MITVQRLVTLGLLIINVALVSSAQLLLKTGATKIAGIFEKAHPVFSIAKTIINPYIFSGTFCYVISLGLWIYILTRAQLSVAYPLMSLSYVAVMILSIYFINESVNLSQWIGAALLIAGTSIIFLCK